MNGGTSLHYLHHSSVLFATCNNGGELQKSLSAIALAKKNMNGWFPWQFYAAWPSFAFASPIGFRRGFTLVLITHKYTRSSASALRFSYFCWNFFRGCWQLARCAEAAVNDEKRLRERTIIKKYRFENAFGDGESHLDNNQPVCWLSTGISVDISCIA